MSLILSGTDGLSDVDGSAATPAIRGTDANTGIFFPAADTIAFSEGGTEVMRIASTGYVGIGNTSPVTNLSIGNGGGGNDLGVMLSRGATTNFYQAYDGTKTFIAGVDNANAFIKIGSLSNHPVGFVVSNVEAARIDTSGNLLVGTTSSNGRITCDSTALGGANQAVWSKNSGGATGGTYIAWNAVTTGNPIFLDLYTETAAIQRGSISYNRAGGLVAYNTTSDYRAKTVNGAVQNALGKVALLKPCYGRMNDAEHDIDFFVAHELQEVVPSAVTGEKDAVNEDNTPKYQMVDKSALIPLLTAAIQEQQALITQLQADVAALKAV